MDDILHTSPVLDKSAVALINLKERRGDQGGGVAIRINVITPKNVLLRRKWLLETWVERGEGKQTEQFVRLTWETFSFSVF